MTEKGLLSPSKERQTLIFLLDDAKIKNTAPIERTVF